MRRFFYSALPLLFAGIGAAHSAEVPPNVAGAIKTIQSVSREGTGNEAAGAAWKVLVQSGSEALIPTLAAFDTASPTAANWLRSAVDGIVQAGRKAKKPLPVAEIESFVKDAKRSPEARRIAFEIYSVEAKEPAAKLLPTLVNDPSVEIRRDAIADRIAKLPASGDPLKAELKTLFAASRDKDQVEEINKKLEELGAKQNVTAHFGFITEWQVVGPFDGPMASGYSTRYPPEAGVDLAKKYDGKGESVTWKYAQSELTYGSVELSKDVGKHKDAVAFAQAVIVSDKETPAEIRVSSPNAIQVYLNGKKLFEREEYHHGAPLDQYVGKGTLKAGSNELLVKVSQNDQKESWAQKWEFAARFCDSTGGNLGLKQLVNKNGKTETVALGALKPMTEPEKKEKK